MAVQRLLLARIDRLPEREKRLLQVGAAAIGDMVESVSFAAAWLLMAAWYVVCALYLLVARRVHNRAADATGAARV